MGRVVNGIWRLRASVLTLPLDRRTGAQVDRVEQLTIRLRQRERGIGPITLDIPRKGPAHYELRDSALGVPGEWEATITARVSDFDAHFARMRFEVRRR